MDPSGMHDGAQSQLLVGVVGVVVGQESAEDGNHRIEQEGCGCFVCGVDEDEDTVSAVDQRVTVSFRDPAGLQSTFDQVVHDLAHKGFRRVGPTG